MFEPLRRGLFIGIKFAHMAKKKTQLSEDQLREMISKITLRYLNEMEGGVYSNIYNGTNNLKNVNQRGLFSTTKVINNKTDGTRRFIGYSC